MTEPVTIDRETAHVAHRELDILIKQTGGDDPPPGEARSPLRLVKQRLKERRVEHEREGISLGIGLALQIIDDVADERGIEIGDIDPLQDDIFQARNDLETALETSC